MPRIQQPYYGLHQITTGQYTEGNEFVIQTGEMYIGAYHILPNGQRFTDFQPSNSSVELFELRLIPTPEILKYNQITGNGVNRYIVPIPFQPNPTLDDYKRTKFERFFIQKRNSPSNTIMEIDGTQYNSINTTNKPGINGVLWNKLKIDWIISKIPKSDAEYLNLQQVFKNLPAFPHLSEFIVDGLEFYR